MPTSTDGRQNGNETDVDCGSDGTGESTNAGPCLDGKKCVKGGDCIDEVCGANHTCSVPTCADKVKNGHETGVDCGDYLFTNCPACGDGMGCNPATTPSDCSSLVCNAATKTCTAPTSSDGTQNGNESDVDCGSSGTGENTSAPACLDINGHTKVTSKCSASADCKSGYCNATEKQCVDGASCALPALAKASGIQDIKTAAKTTSATTNDANDAVGTPNVNGAGLYAGIDTCGQGEATDAPGSRKLESCCKSLDVAATGDRVDKYEVTAGRMRQFVESINAKYPDYNFKAWVAAQFNGTSNLPTTAIGTTLYSQIPTPTAVANSTDTRVLFPSSQRGVLNAVEQLGATSIDTGIPSDLQGCYVGLGNAGSSTYWWDAAGESIVGSPPRQFTQDYYDIKPLNCALYWMAAAFCAWDGGYLPDDAHYQALWGTGNYPWGADTTYPTTSSGSRNYEDLGGGAAYGNAGSPAITKYTINNLNDDYYEGSYGDFYFYPKGGNPSTGTIPDTIDNLADFSPYIAGPGRFLPDVSQYKASAGSIYAGDGWYDLAANLFEFHALPTSKFAENEGIFCDTSNGVVNPGTTPSTCDSTQGDPCTRLSDGQQVCGYIRGSGSAAAPVSVMPNVELGRRVVGSARRSPSAITASTAPTR